MTSTMKKSPSVRRFGRMAGLSLVELMIAMTLGLVTVGAVGYIYLGTSKTYRTQDALARLQEGARYAFEVISSDIRMAGATGCAYSTATNVITDYEDVWFANLFEQPLVAEDANGGSGTVTEFSDALRTVRADVSREYVVQVHNTGGVVTFPAAHDITAGALMLATDCNHAAVFQVETASGTQITYGATGTPGNATTNLGASGAYEFLQGSRLYKLAASTYYVDTNPAGEPALYRMRPVGAAATATPEELIEGVEDFQVTFGVDTNAALDGEIDFIDPDGDGDPYLTAAQVNALAGTPQDRWARVVSVRISLLMRTVEDNVLPESQTYTYNGTTTTPAERRLRKVFTHVVAMRNR